MEIYDTVLVDVNCVAHLAYNQYWGDNEEQDIKTYIKNLLDIYYQFPFLKTKSYVVFSDAPPYWRTRVLSRKCGTVYKGTRAEKTSEKKYFLNKFGEMSDALKYLHYEADDLIANYIKLAPKTEKICILTVDSDLLQLAKDNVTWMCCNGFYPQIRSESNGNLKIWLDKKFSTLSKKRIGHLDTSKAATIVDWKVEYGDKSDNIPAGEASRCLIDLNSVEVGIDLLNDHPEFMEDVEKKRKFVVSPEMPFNLVRRYEEENLCSFITRMPNFVG